MLKLRYDVFGADVLGNAKMEGKYEFPMTPGIRLDGMSARIVPFDRMGELKEGEWLLFYVHDKRFCNLLARRRHYADVLNRADGFIGADNSIYRDLPLAEQIHSCYVNRAIDHYLHSIGKTIVPNVSWGDWRSHEFCCDGIEPGATVAMSTYGCCNSALERAYFEDGFVFAASRLHPYSVFLHGAVWPRLKALAAHHGVKIAKVPTWRETIAARRGTRHG